MQKVPLLDGSSYATWAIKMEMVLESKGIWDTVENGLPTDPPPSDEVIKADRKARAEMGLCLGDDHLSVFTENNSAKSLWQALKGIYQQKSQARKLVLNAQLIGLKKSSKESVAKYIARVKQIRDELIAAGDQPNDDLLTLTVLKGLPDEYKDVRAQMQTTVQLTLDNVESKLLVVEQNLASWRQGPFEYVPAVACALLLLWSSRI